MVMDYKFFNPWDKLDLIKSYHAMEVVRTGNECCPKMFEAGWLTRNEAGTFSLPRIEVWTMLN
jgi:hypothetical protein